MIRLVEAVVNLVVAGLHLVGTTRQAHLILAATVVMILVVIATIQGAAIAATTQEVAIQVGAPLTVDINDYTNYIDRYGLVQPEPNTISDNGIRFTSEAILAGYPEPEKLMKAIKSCEVKWGIFQRSPGNTRQEGWDDYIGTLSSSITMKDPWIARRILLRGVFNLGFFFTNGFSFKELGSAFLWRSPSLFAFNVFAATGILFPLIPIFKWSLSLSAESEDQDSKVLAWLMVRHLKGHYRTLDDSITNWQKKLDEQYPDGIGGVLGRYYSPEGYRHPNSKYLMNVRD